MFTRAGNRAGGVVRIIATLMGSGALLAACGGGGGGGSAPAPTLSVGGSVTGLAGGSVVLRNNGGNDLTVTANGTFTFTNTIANGASYGVTVATQPTAPAQTCTVANGSGTASASVSNITVTCATNTYNLGGTVSGLTGAGLVLANGATTLPVAANATTFTFASAIPSGTAYNITVGTQPAGQTCSVANGGGTIGAAAVTNVTITCSTNNYTVSGTIAGLTGSNMVLQLNGGNDLARPTGSTTFAFPAISATSPYAVTVSSQPNTPSQTCTVANGAGTGGANVTNVAVTCATNTYAINVNVTGLSGTGLVLRNNGTQSLNIAANGAASFATPIVSGGTYAVTVQTQPTGPSQSCVIANGTGTVAGGAVNVNVTCSTSAYTVGGTVSGLAGTGLQLANNGVNGLAVSTNGSFTFTNSVGSGQPYAVSVLFQPTTPAQTCVITNGSGTVGSGNVTNVTVTCTTTTFTVGGSLTGLPAGTNVVLQNNAGDNKTINANGNFTFTTGVADAGAYAVTVLTQPTWDPATSTSAPRSCDVKTGSGTVAGANVTTVKVVCRSRYAFVANRSGDGALTSYSIGSTGALTRIDSETVQSALATAVPAAAEADAEGVATTPTVTHAFVSVDGALADANTATVSGIIKVYDVAADGSMVFAHDFAVPKVLPTPNRASDPLTILVHPGMSVSDAANRRRVYVMDANPDLAAGPPISFAQSFGNEVIHEYSFTYATATLTHEGQTSVPSISSAVMDPLGDYIWTTTYTGHQVLPLKINASTGALTPQAGTAIGTVNSEIAIAIDPTGTLLFAAHKQDAKIYVYEINRTTGALTIKDTKDTWAPTELTVPVVALLVNPDTTKPILYAARTDGKVQQYTITGTTGNVYSIALTGTATRTLVNVAHDRFRLHMDSEGQTLYHIDWNTTGDFGLFRPNATTGLLDTAATLFTPQNVGGTPLTGTMGMTLP